jgi:hypothetical protein
MRWRAGFQQALRASYGFFGRIGEIVEPIGPSDSGISSKSTPPHLVHLSIAGSESSAAK